MNEGPTQARANRQTSFQKNAPNSSSISKNDIHICDLSTLLQTLIRNKVYYLEIKPGLLRKPHQKLRISSRFYVCNAKSAKSWKLWHSETSGILSEPEPVRWNPTNRDKVERYTRQPGGGGQNCQIGQFLAQIAHLQEICKVHEVLVCLIVTKTSDTLFAKCFLIYSLPRNNK